MVKKGLQSVGKFSTGQEILLFHQPEIRDPNNPEIIRQYESRVSFIIHTFPDERKAICYQQSGGLNQYFGILVRDIQKLDAMGSYEERMERFNEVANFDIEFCACGTKLDLETEVLAGYDTCADCLLIEGNAAELAERGHAVDVKISYEARLMALHERVRSIKAALGGHGASENF